MLKPSNLLTSAFTSSQNPVARKILIKGIVQGVGFRPFVYLLAHKYELKGTVSNTAAGVLIYTEGALQSIQDFCTDLEKESPPLAHITDITVSSESIRNYPDFTIIQSQDNGRRTTLISPDVAVCDDCRAELVDPHNRRYQYPFINCTNCGPRYTIIKDVPYDRPSTCMHKFALCRLCQAEYDNPHNRRFHAQPNACPACGPHVSLYDNQKSLITDVNANTIEETVRLLKQGAIIVIKGLGGFHLVADATDNNAILRLRRRKQRDAKPLAMMAGTVDQIRRFAHVNPDEEILLNSYQRPIVLLTKKQNHLIASAVAPHNRYLGVMLPYTPLHYLLFNYNFEALVMTSGNSGGMPICIANGDAFKMLSDIADYFLIHNRDICLRCDDSVVKYTHGAVRFLRRARGYAPMPIFLRHDTLPILACGGELKNTVCLTKGDQAFLSQHIGDLKNHETYIGFQQTIRHLQKILDIKPEIVACDLHPDYLSTRYARELNTTVIAVQHHHAHIISCLAENRAQGPVIGLALDGTGYGSDGAAWGGEVLLADMDQFQRMASLAYTALPGNNAAVKAPWRLAVSYLYASFGEDFQNLNLPLFEQVGDQKIRFIADMINKKINSPLTSSLGRLFDGVAAIIGLCNHISFEGQAAMNLEMIAADSVETSYNYELDYQEVCLILWQPLIRGIVQDMHNGVSVAIISARFHATVIKMFCEACEVIRKKSGVNQVALSGGVFQNTFILTGMMRLLQKKDFQVYTHKITPCNDGGLSLGQALIADAIAKSSRH
ncbi:carbamoyltransferase HypF [Desulfococcaceae bacterium HSG9]|nr:carbamoyltransferase HypF [Desulfococcaceae bacterium HSG9]